MRVEMLEKKWVKDLGISILAVVVSQIVYGLFIPLISMALESGSQIPYINIIALLAAGLAASLAGGLFQGRLLPDRNHSLYILAGVGNVLYPFVSQGLRYGYDFSWLMERMALLILSGSIAIWYLGSWLGHQSKTSKPSPTFDKKLLKAAAIVAVALLSLNVILWAMIHFPENYRAAAKISLPLPPEVTEKKGPAPDPWTANHRQFELEMSPFSTRISDFFNDYFTNQGFMNVSSDYQQETHSDPWNLVETKSGETNYTYYISSEKWVSNDRKALISLLLYATKKDPSASWEASDWQISGIIYTRPYAEPPPREVSQPSPTVSENTIPPEHQPTQLPFETPTSIETPLVRDKGDLE
ncbi:hypothetical protein JW979_03985 [bacterium]|nr:hypothetical protein [candidate division CSSED10-310 bacterium]